MYSMQTRLIPVLISMSMAMKGDGRVKFTDMESASLRRTMIIMLVGGSTLVRKYSSWFLKKGVLIS